MIWSKSRVPSAHIGRRPRAVVVTGASSGIGRASAMKLARSGFRVFAGVRKEEAGALEEAAPAGRLTPLFIDVADETFVAGAASTVEEAVGGEGIAGLVNNAGIGEAWPL